MTGCFPAGRLFLRRQQLDQVFLLFPVNLDRPILLTERKSSAIITLNRPAQLNCLTREVMDELARVSESLRKNAGLLTLIMTGSGGVFSAGADLSEVAALDPRSAYYFSRRGQAILASFNHAAPVTIAAIDGYCLGGGLDLALSCDLRYATPRSSFQHPGAKRGIITGWGGTQRLPRLIGMDLARRLLVSGDRIGAEEARQIGLINRISEDSLGFACQLAERIASRFTRQMLAAIKQIVDS
jgi:enoyl-CoA hydratase